MRWIIGITVLLSALGAGICRIDLPAHPPDAGDEWVRTVDGWEKPTAWQPPEPVYDPSLHPLVVALGQSLLSVTALVALCDPCRRRSHIEF